MARSFFALINKDILSWIRSHYGFDIDYIANKAGIKPEKLHEWETGSSRPTIAQLRKIAKVYGYPIAIFYLPEPPDIKLPRIKDRRLLLGYEERETPPELIHEFRRASERREIMLELLANTEAEPKIFDSQISLEIPPESVGSMIRKMLGISYEEQFSWREPRVAFNSWRNLLEQLDILIFQAPDVSPKAMRGYSIFFNELPIIGINRKDTYNARSFSLIHEMTHLLLKSDSLCDFKVEEVEGDSVSPPDKEIEIFCNAVAGCTLVPGEIFMKEGLLSSAAVMDEEGEKSIKELSRKYGVSRYVIARRLLSLGLVDDNFYETKHEQYKTEYAEIEDAASKRKKRGFPPPVNDVFSLNGRNYVGLVVENLNQGFITTSDFSDYLGIKIKHLERIQDSFLLT
jgi:Zn-dependent peptidase ImmA (M78 family)